MKMEKESRGKESSGLCRYCEKEMEKESKHRK